jgi:hypothetical protein
MPSKGGKETKITSRRIGRDARTGEFISIKEAKRRPKTTVVERVPTPGRGVTKKK